MIGIARMARIWLLALAVAISQLEFSGSGTAPEIKSVGSFRRVSPGAKVFMPCVVTGNPHPTVSWDKEGQPISKFGNIYSLNNDSQALRIFNVQIGDEGNFTCTARNKYGVDRITYTFIVMLIPNASIVSPNNFTFMELTNQQIVCRSRGLSKVSFEWLTSHHERIRATDYLNDSKASNRRLYAFDREAGEQIYESVLMLQPATFEDFGRLACVAYNDIGHSRVTISLNVLFSPKVLSVHTLPQRVTWWEGHNSNLTCAVAGNELPVITWFKNGRHFKCNNLVEHSGESEIVSTCTINNRTDGGPGVYRCKATNKLNQILVHEFHVEEYFPPPVVEFTPISIHLDEMTLAVKVPFKENTPPATYVLATYNLVSNVTDIHKIQEIERMGDLNANGEGTVTLVGLSENSEYNVSVTARNSVGFGPKGVRVISTAWQQVVTPKTSSPLPQVLFDNNNKSGEKFEILIIDENEIIDEAKDDNADEEEDFLDARTAFAVRSSNNGVATIIRFSKHCLSLALCLFLCSSFLP